MSAAIGSPLECAILGLVWQSPRSGYDLMKAFSETAMGSFSGSPGVIYPAVQRLERRRLIRGATKNAATLRPRRVFSLTPAGRATLERYLLGAVTRGEIVRNPGGVLLRFAFAGEMAGAAAASQILEQFAAAIDAYLPELECQLAELDRHRQSFGRHALQRGIDRYRSDARWARRTSRLIRSKAEGRRRAQRAGGET